MGGKFVFQLRDSSLYQQQNYLAAIRHIRKTFKAPQDVYVGYGPEDRGQAMVIKVSNKTNWTLVLPVDPTKYELECGFSYGVVSRTTIWQYLKSVLLAVCQSCPGAFELYWEDGDLGEGVKEVGNFDPNTGQLVVRHVGLPSVSQFEEEAASYYKPSTATTNDNRAALGLNVAQRKR